MSTTESKGESERIKKEMGRRTRFQKYLNAFRLETSTSCRKDRHELFHSW